MIPLQRILPEELKLTPRQVRSLLTRIQDQTLVILDHGDGFPDLELNPALLENLLPEDPSA